MAITASLVKTLRDKTGVGMMECKKALESSNGDIELAIKELREKGLSKAAKKSDRSTKEGRIITAINDSTAVILEINCETDFVGSNENFIELGRVIAKSITENNVETVDDVKQLTIDGSTVDELISDAVLKLGENIVIGQFKRLTTAGAFSDYEHTNGKIGVIVEFSGSIDEESGKGIAMQVAAMNPPYISSDQVPQSDLDSEAEIMRNQALSEGKPEQVVDKIVQGRLSKFYKENCLVDQVYVKDQDKQIKDLLSEGTTILSVERFSLAG